MSTWQRRSSTLRLGGRPSQDLIGGTAQRFQDRNSRIPLPRSSSQASVAHKPDLPATFKRSKSTLGAPFTPQEKAANVNKITPQAIPFTPQFYLSYSSKKPGHYKDTRNLQDKEFQRDATTLVMRYVENYPDIKLIPMTIKGFVDMVNHVFAQLGIYNKDELVQFTPQTYLKEMPHWLAYLEYPGNVGKSWLQTVNVPQCLPHVMGLLSWLVNLIQCTSGYDLEEHLRPSIEQDPYKLFDWHYFIGCLHAFHQISTVGNTDPDTFGHICENLVALSEQTKGVTPEAFEKLISENEKLKEIADDPSLKTEQATLDELEQRLNVAESQSIKAVEDSLAKTEAIDRIKQNSAKKERNIAALKNDAHFIRQEVEVLKRKVESQSMSVNEFSEIEKKCDYLLKEISYTEKECEDNEKLVSRYEHDIATKRDKILQNASMFNRQVIQLEQQIPDLQGLRARTNPESADVVEEVEKLLHALRAIKTRLAAEYEELAVLRLEKQQRVDNLKERLRDVASSEVTVRERVRTKKAEIDQLRAEASEEEKLLDLEVKELEKRKMVFEQKQQENEKQIQKIQQLEKRLELLDRCKVKMAELVEAKCKKIDEKIKYFKGQISSLKNKVQTNEGEIEKMIDELVSELHN